MKHKQHRGISVGTIVMSLLTAVVLIVSAAIFPRLMGTADLDIDVGGMLSALTLDDAMPVLAMSDIPIERATEAPAVTAEPSTSPEATPPAATPEPTATPHPGGTVTLTIGGSVNIEDAIRKSAYYSDSGKYDFAEIVALLRDEMDSDLTLLTLENLTYGADKVSALNAPEAVMDMLADAGVDVLALGFPKAYDKGFDALTATVEAARSRGMTTLGAYDTQQDAEIIRLFTVDHVNIALLHYTSALSSTGKKAVANDGADYAVPTIDAARMADDIRTARSQGADVVIVSLNWGKQSASKPTEEQKQIAQQLADAGADVIVGAGTRVVQPVSWLTAKDTNGAIRHTLCAWNLGSLINESRKDGNVVGMLLQLQIGFDGNAVSFERVSYTPTYIWRFKQDGSYRYRIAVSDLPAPDGMSDEQIGYMEKALRNIRKTLEGSPVTLREP